MGQAKPNIKAEWESVQEDCPKCGHNEQKINPKTLVVACPLCKNRQRPYKGAP